MAADVLQRIHPEIAKFAEALLNNEGIGVCGELLKIVEPKSRYSIRFSIYVKQHFDEFHPLLVMVLIGQLRSSVFKEYFQSQSKAIIVIRLHHFFCLVCVR